MSVFCWIMNRYSMSMLLVQNLSTMQITECRLQQDTFKKSRKFWYVNINYQFCNREHFAGPWLWLISCSRLCLRTLVRLHSSTVPADLRWEEGAPAGVWGVIMSAWLSRNGVQTRRQMESWLPQNCGWNPGFEKSVGGYRGVLNGGVGAGRPT